MVKFLVNFSLKSISVYFFFFLMNSNVVFSNENVFSNLDKLHSTLTQISKNIINKQKIDVIEATIHQAYDLDKMSRIILGDYWTKSSYEEREKFKKNFALYISRNYFKRFSKIEKFTYNYKGFDNIGSNYKIAYFEFKFNEDEIFNINYMLIERKEWLVFDVLIDGSISEIATKKSEFTETLENGGVQSLVNLLKTKSKI